MFERKYEVELRLTPEEIDRLSDVFPEHPAVAAALAQIEYDNLPQPKNPTGRTRSGVRLYKDLYGFNASGYTLVHWDDAKSCSWCASNGYFQSIPDSEQPVVWEDDPKSDALIERRVMLSDRIAALRAQARTR